MFGILLMAIGGLFEEGSTSIGKIALRKHVETPFTYGVLVTCGVWVVLALSALVRWDAQSFQWASVPTLALRTGLEVILAVTVIHAIKRADRSTFGFLRTLTIPFLLVVDVILAYHIDTFQIMGMILFVLALFILFINHGFSGKGAWLTVLASLLAVVTTSLYKYNLTHFNSPEVEQLVVYTVLFLFFVVMSVGVEKTHPFRLFRKPACLAQAGLLSVGMLLGSLSFLYAAPSVLMTVKRGSEVLAAILTGRTVFHEKKVVLKMGAAGLMLCGFILLFI